MGRKYSRRSVSLEMHWNPDKKAKHPACGSVVAVNISGYVDEFKAHENRCVDCERIMNWREQVIRIRQQKG